MKPDTKYVIKGKRADNGKAWIVGNAKAGNYGPRLGIRVTQEFRDMVNAVEDGGYLNLDVYEDDKGVKYAGDARHQPAPAAAPRQRMVSPIPELDDSIPFAAEF